MRLLHSTTPAQTFRLYWLRETDFDRGTPLRAHELPAAIRERVLELAAPESAENDTREFLLRLPYFDRREWRARDEILAATQLERHGNLIRAVLDPSSATRDMAATLALTDPAWRDTPNERDPAYFETWQRVSMALQAALKRWIAAAYFEDLARLENRDAAFSLLVYQCSRGFTGKPRSEFTYDLRDYPDCKDTLALASKLIGCRVQEALRTLEQRLLDAGRPALARRYSPVWHEDAVMLVRRKPRRLAELLAAESAIVNAAIDLGTERTPAAVGRCARIINSALRNVEGLDLRKLGVAVFEVATRALTQPTAGAGQDLFDGRVFEDGHVSPPGGPYARIGGQKYGDHGDAHGSREMRDPRVVADVQPRSGEPARQLV
jgi:hypothetical protein